MAIFYDANRKIFYKHLSLVLECLARKGRESGMSCCAACAGAAACRFLRQAGDNAGSNPSRDPEMDRAAKNGFARRAPRGRFGLPRDEAAVRISAVSSKRSGLYAGKRALFRFEIEDLRDDSVPKPVVG